MGAGRGAPGFGLAGCGAPASLSGTAIIAPGDTAALEALLLDRWIAAHPEHRLEQREEESHESQARRRRKRAARRIAVAL
jgi:hypothetical protein